MIWQLGCGGGFMFERALAGWRTQAIFAKSHLQQVARGKRINWPCQRESEDVHHGLISFLRMRLYV
jgi:hypothetical protein